MPIYFRAFVIAFIGIGVLRCGIYGPKVESDLEVDFESNMAACFKDLTFDMDSYLRGEVEAKEWASVFDCVNESLDSIENLVEGSVTSGYSVSDIQIFVQDVVVTDTSVSRRLISTFLELKASIVGGGLETLSIREKNELRAFVETLRDESVHLLPHIRRYHEGPTLTDLTNFSKALQAFGERLGERITNSSRKIALQKATLIDFLNEVSIFAESMSLDARVIDVFFELKRLLITGSNSEIEPELWKPLLRTMGSVTGATLGIVKIKEQRDKTSLFQVLRFVSRFVQKFKSDFLEILSYHQNAIPLRYIDSTLDAFGAYGTPISVDIVKKSLRPGLYRIFQARKENQFDDRAAEEIYGIMEKWNSGMDAIDRVYEEGRLPPRVDPVRLIDAITEFQKNEEKQDLKEAGFSLIEIVRSYRFQYEPNDLEIWQQDIDLVSKLQLQQFLWAKTLGRTFLDAYAADPEIGMTRDEFSFFVEDFRELMGALGLMDPRSQTVVEHRLRDMNLFMPSSNGDGNINLSEVTYFTLHLASSKILYEKLLRHTARCRFEEIDGRDEPLMDPVCVREVFWNDVKEYWNHYPGLLSYYQDLKDEKKSRLRDAVEIAARGTVDNQKPFESFDLDGLVGMMTYVETVFWRFDHNRNGLLGVRETLDAFPVFQNQIAEIAGLDPNEKSTLEAVFTFLVAKQRIPNWVDILFWKVKRPIWSFQANRLDVYETISFLTNPELSN